MDIAYDRIQEETLSPEEIAGKERDGKEEQQGLNTEFQQAYKAFSSSPWGAKFGAFVGNVKKQGESYYEEARQEYSAASSQASKGLSDIISRTRSLSLTQPGQASSSTASVSEKQPEGDNAGGPADKPAGGDSGETETDTEGVLARFRSEAFKRLKEIEKAEDAADEALLKFGTNIRNFLRDAVSIAPPAEGEGDLQGAKGKVLFESKDQDGKRVIHSTRFDAQLHVIHSSLDSFAKEPVSPQYADWAKEFSAESKTEDIARDLDKYKELRSAMETLVPDRVSYDDFWTRYYFLRHVIETEEQRRKELLKGAATEDEEIAWDEDSDTSAPTSPRPGVKAASNAKLPSTESSTTLHPNVATDQTTPAPVTASADSTLKPGDSSRKSNDQHSQPDSDASYDVVSGAPSAAPSSPKQIQVKKVDEDSDEEDWE